MSTSQLTCCLTGRRTRPELTVNDRYLQHADGTAMPSSEGPDRHAADTVCRVDGRGNGARY